MPLVRVADADPDLFAGIDDPNARAASVAEVIRFERGSWRGPLDGLEPSGHFGLLLIEGVLIRRVKFARRPVLELAGAGDVLRPWVTLGPDSSLQQPSHWRVH